MSKLIYRIRYTLRFMRQAECGLWRTAWYCSGQHYGWHENDPIEDADTELYYWRIEG